MIEKYKIVYSILLLLLFSIYYILERLKSLTDDYEQRISDLRVKLQEELTKSKKIEMEERRKYEANIREEYERKLENKNQLIMEYQQNYNKEKLELQKKLSEECEIVNQKLDLERRKIEQNLISQYEENYRIKEMQMRKELTEQRDKQIDNILNKIAEETNNKVTTTADEYENKIRNMKVSFQMELQNKQTEIDSLKKKISIQEGIINSNDENVKAIENNLQDANDKLRERLTTIQSLETKIRQHESEISFRCNESKEPLLKQIKQLEIVYIYILIIIIRKIMN